MNTHTPGPWIKERNLITDQDGQDIATVTYRQSGYVQANTRLIAAAPDLIEALKALHKHFITESMHIGEAEEALERISMAAITKAEGRDGE